MPQPFSDGDYPDAGTSSIQATSLRITLTDSNGAVLYESQGGLALLQGLKIWPGMGYISSKVQIIEFGAGMAIGDPQQESQAVHVALRDLVLTPEALSAELNPEPQQKGRKKR